MVERLTRFRMALIGAFGLAYFGGAELGHAFSFTGSQQTFATFWPPAGLLVAALALAPFHLWLPLLLTAWCANLVSDVLLHDKSLAVSLGFCLANTLEACFGAWLLRRYIGSPFTFARLKDVVRFALAAMFSTMAGAIAGAATVVLAFGNPFWSAWLTWWSADALGVFVIAPVILTWAAERASLIPAGRSRRIVEAAVLFLGMALAAEGVYGEWFPAPFMIPIFILPFLLWAAARFGPRGAAVAILLVATIGAWNTSQGRGPYTALTSLPSQQVLRAQGTLAVISLCVFLLAAAVSERKQSEQERLNLIAKLKEALTEIHKLRGMIPICAWCSKIRTTAGDWQDIENYLRVCTQAEFSHGICPECLEQQYESLPSKTNG
jgi:integral membrane sensor domain MASE1